MRSLISVHVLRGLVLAACALSAQAQNLRIVCQVGGVDTSVPNGGAVTLSTDAVGHSVTSGFSLFNVATSSVTVTQVGVSGSTGFSLAGVPSLPATVAAGNLLAFFVQYTATSAAHATGTVTIATTEGDSKLTYTVQLTGTVVGTSSLPSFGVSYTDPRTNNAIAVLDGGVINFGQVNLTAGSDITVTVLNRGAGSGAVSNVSLTGASAFELHNLPVFPAIVASGASMTFVIHFAPDAQQAYSGVLRIDLPDRTWNIRLDGSGVGAAYGYSVVTGGGTVQVQPGGTIRFTDTPVGNTQATVLHITNTGTAQGQISGITLSDAVFRVADAPATPFPLKPGASSDVTFAFTPQSQGSFSTRVLIGDDSFTLSGVGMGLPRYTFEGASGVQNPLQQPAVGLTLAEPYPVPITGTLTLSFVSDVFGANPAVQFSTGGRTAAFTIPANSSKAVFDNSQTTIRIQTGTVAGNLVVTPTFTTQAGLNLSPLAPESLSLTVSRSVPQLLEGHLSSRTLTGFTLAITGYTTTRSLGKLDLQLNAKTGVRLDNSHLIVDLQSPAMIWFQNTNSEDFGGMYNISVPVLLQGGTSSEDQTAHIQSVAVAVSNDVGGSNTITVPLP
jgi:hypothetical protein